MPEHVFVLKCSKDVCQERMVELEGTPQYQPSSILGQLIREYNENNKSLMPFLADNLQVHEINTDDLFANSWKEVCKAIDPVVISVSFDEHSNGEASARNVVD